MILKIISGALILITAFLGFKHGWSGIRATPETEAMMNGLGINKPIGIAIGIITLAAAIFVLFPATFFVGNVINAATILLIMAFALKAGNIKMALIEIPFLLMPLVLIYLGHPFKK